MIKRIKRLICGITAAIICLACLAGCGSNSEVKGSQVNIMIVMDVSDSMSQTDPSGCAKFATNMLVSAFDDYKVPFVSSENISSGARIGVVTYGKEAKETVELTKLKNAGKDTYDGLRKRIDAIEYDNSTGTNFYAGLDMAMDICEKNPAEENIIFLMSDGQFALNDKTVDEAKAKQKYISKYNDRIASTPNCTIYTVGIDTSGSKDSDKYFEDLKRLSTFNENGLPNHYVVKDNTTALTDMFAGFIEDIYQIINPDADKIVAVPEIDGNTCTFTLDKRYKTVQVLLATDSSVGKGEKLKVESIKTPKSKGTEKCSPQMKIKGSTININENSGIAASVYIDNAYKGEWVLQLNTNASIVAKVFIFNPFPWHIIPITAALILLIILAVMWGLRIPPVRYRRKSIPGNITVSVESDGNEVYIYDNEPIVSIMRNGKYLRKGNLTLGTLLRKKKYKHLVFKYIPMEDEFGTDALEIKNTSGAGGIYGCKIYVDGSGTVNLSVDEIVNIAWSN